MSFKTTVEDSYIKQQDARGEWKVKINFSCQLQPPVLCRDEAHADTVIQELKVKRES